MKKLSLLLFGQPDAFALFGRCHLPPYPEIPLKKIEGYHAFTTPHIALLPGISSLPEQKQSKY
jgi:hypothetical protein